MVFSSANICFVGLFQVYENQRANRLEIFSEVITLCTLYLLLLFTDFVPPSRTRYNIGFFFIALVGGVLAFRLSLIYVATFKSMCNRCK